MSINNYIQLIYISLYKNPTFKTCLPLNTQPAKQAKERFENTKVVMRRNYKTPPAGVEIGTGIMKNKVRKVIILELCTGGFIW